MLSALEEGMIRRVRKAQKEAEDSQTRLNSISADAGDDMNNKLPSISLNRTKKNNASYSKNDSMMADSSKELKAAVKSSAPSVNRKLTLIVLSAFLGLLVTIWRRYPHKSFKWWSMLLSLLAPAVVAASVFISSQNMIHQRILAAVFVSPIIGTQLPRSISAMGVCGTLVWFGLWARPKGQVIISQRTRQARLRAILSALLLTSSLLTENFFIWVISATYWPSHDGRPQPLQDNMRLAQQHIWEGWLDLTKREIVQLRGLLNVQWALVGVCFTSLCILELKLVPSRNRNRKRSLWTVGYRTVMTLALSRVIRVISFLMTVLPSQNPNCYRERFPNPPPSDWIEWITVGLKPMAHGGCNDLIMSGHATVTSTMATLATSVAGHNLFSFSVWILLAIDFSVEVYEGFHYSVDMWLGGLITVMMWRILAPLEDSNVGGDENDDVEEYEFSVASATRKQWSVYSVPAVGAYITIVFIPEKYAIGMIVLYTIWTAFAIATFGANQYARFILFLLLFIALCTFL